MNSLRKKILVLLPILLCIGLICAFAWHTLYRRYHPMSFVPASFQESSAILDNPYRGFYHMYGFTLSEENPEDTARRARQYIDSGSLQLMLIQINLKNYANADLSDNALEQLDLILSQANAAKRQVILRFLYDWDGKALETEPDSIDWILRHMEQLGPVVNRYADTVFVIQGTSTGNCGEMTQTKFGSHESNRLLMTRLAQVTDPSIYLAVRTPSHLRGVTQTRETVTPETAYDGSLASRLGLFNDGMLGSVYDLGTYDDTPNADTTAPEDKGTREEELSFQDALCQFVPNGGEAVLDNPYSDLESAIPDLRRMHVTYLNCDHDAAVMDKWKASVYGGEDCFDGVRGYDYIDAHLGYRYVVTDASLSYDALDETSCRLLLTIENRGFAPAYRLFEAAVTLEHTDTGMLVTLPVSLDNRTIGGGSEAAFSLPLAVIGLPQGTYSVSLSMTDPYTERRILFANLGYDQKGPVLLGELTIEPASPEGLLSLLLERLQNR